MTVLYICLGLCLHTAIPIYGHTITPVSTTTVSVSVSADYQLQSTITTTPYVGDSRTDKTLLLGASGDYNSTFGIVLRFDSSLFTSLHRSNGRYLAKARLSLYCKHTYGIPIPSNDSNSKLEYDKTLRKQQQQQLSKGIFGTVQSCGKPYHWSLEAHTHQARLSNQSGYQPYSAFTSTIVSTYQSACLTNNKFTLNIMPLVRGWLACDTADDLAILLHVKLNTTLPPPNDTGTERAENDKQQVLEFHAGDNDSPPIDDRSPEMSVSLVGKYTL
jgi:hypothetical protein